MSFRTVYGAHKRVFINFGEELSRTKQSFKDECDINNIVRHANKAGLPPKDPEMYADVSDPVDYQTACNVVLRANEQFNSLDSKTRDRFANDPQRFLEFVYSGENVDEMVSMGLMKREAVERVEAAKQRVKKGSGGKSSPPDEEPKS